MNWNSVIIFLTDIINIYLESFELLQNKIIHIQNKHCFIIIRKYAFRKKFHNESYIIMRNCFLL